MLRAVGAAFAMGAPLDTALLADRPGSRPFPIPWRPRFFANPCELAPLPEESTAQEPIRTGTSSESAPAPEASPVDRAISVLELFRRQVAARVELPESSVEDGNRLLGDLHLNSIAVGQLVSEMARQLGAPPPAEPLAFADVTVAEAAEALEELARSGGEVRPEEADSTPRGVATWFRAFAPILAERPRPRRRIGGEAGPWRVIASPGDSIAETATRSLAGSSLGRGVVVCLPPEPDERHIGLLLEAARAVLEDAGAGRFVMVQHGGGASSFARTLALEALGSRSAWWMCRRAILDRRSGSSPRRKPPPVSPRSITTNPDCGASPMLRLSPSPTASPRTRLGPADVLLVSGGGKGIAAECALGLARETGVSLALIGRSRPEADTDSRGQSRADGRTGIEIPLHLRRRRRRGCREGRDSRGGVDLGPITAVLHGAGANVPRPIGSLDEVAFLETLAPKTRGLRNLLDAIRPERLKLLVTFGSIIARTGLPGEADYGVANEWLSRMTEEFQARHPGCHCLAMEWSVWSGVGMGDRLGRVDALARQGIAPISVDEGVSLFRRLVSGPSPSVSVVLAGRFGIPPALPIEGGELPLLRFLERPMVDYPGVELVAESTLSAESDPYLDDHVFRGERLFPAVMGLEAMSQAAMAVLRTEEVPRFEAVHFDRPIVVVAGRPTTIRVAALVTEPGRVDVVIRSDETAFQLDHFRASCRFGVTESGLADDAGTRSRAMAACR